MSKTFDPWKDSERAAKRATLRMGFDPMAVALVKHRGSPLAFLLPTLPREAPLRRWCAAGQVLKLGKRGEATLTAAEVKRAVQLCLVHELAMPRWLMVAHLVHLEAPPLAAPDAKELQEKRREARRQRKVWELVRRFGWAHPGLSKEVLWGALTAGPLVGSGLEEGVHEAARRMGMGRTTAVRLLNEASALYEKPTWPAKVAPPTSHWLQVKVLSQTQAEA